MRALFKILLFITLYSGSSLSIYAQTHCIEAFYAYTIRTGKSLKAYGKSLFIRPVKKIKIQAKHYITLQEKTNAGMSLTGNEAYDAFRIGFNNGITINDGKFIAYITNAGTLVNGKIIKLERDKVIIIDEYNNLTTLQNEELNTIRVSHISKQIFLEMNQSLLDQKITHFTVPSKAAFYNDQGGIQYGIIKDLKDIEIIVASVVNTKTKKTEFIDLDITSLIKPLKPGSIISFTGESPNPHINAKVISESPTYEAHTPTWFEVAFIRDGSLHIKKVNSSEIRPPIEYTNEEALSIKIPPKKETKEYYFLNLAYPIKNNSSRWNKWNIEPSSPLLKKWITKAVNIIEQRTGIHPIKNIKLSETDRYEIYEVWLNDIVTQMATPNYAHYLISKKWILKNSQNRDLGYILNEGIAMDFELALFGTILFREYGINVKIGQGILKENTQTPNLHTWIQVLNTKGLPIEVIDNNQAKGIYSSQESYIKTVSILNNSVREFSLYAK